MIYAILISYVLFSSVISVVLVRRNYLSQAQKVSNVLLVLMLPFIFGLLVLKLTKQSDYKTIIKKHRRNKMGMSGHSSMPMHDGGDAAY